MKAFFLLSLFAVPALSAWFSGEGTFRFSHEIDFLSYASQAECGGDAGRWSKGVCYFPGIDEVQVERAGLDHVVKVSTVTTNAHMCEFEGRGRFEADGSLRASQAAESWSEEKGEWVPGVCEVSVRYLDGDSVSVSHQGSCQSLCGMRGELNIARAVRAGR